MAQGNYRDYLRGERIRVKKYFYVLRPILAINWLERGMGVVPTEFGVLADAMIDDPVLLGRINALIEAKRDGQELDDGPRIPEISDFLDREIGRLEGQRFEAHIEKMPVDILNRLFRDTLQEVWH